MQGLAFPAVKRIRGENKLEKSVPVLALLQTGMGYDSQSKPRLKWARIYNLPYLLYSCLFESKPAFPWSGRNVTWVTGRLTHRGSGCGGGCLTGPISPEPLAPAEKPPAPSAPCYSP